MRGTVEGGLWALVLATAGLSLASHAARQPVVGAPAQVMQTSAPASVPAPPGQNAPAAPPPALDFAAIASTVPPAYDANIVRLLRAPDTGSLPDRPEATRPPVVSASVDLLTVPSRLRLPMIDRTTPAPPVARPPAPVIVIPLPAPAPLPDVPDAPAIPADLPEIDTSQAPVAEPSPAPRIIAPEPDDTQVIKVDSRVRINRPTTQTRDTSAQEQAIAVPDEQSGDLPALVRYGASFENPDDLAVIGIMLLDDSSLVDGPAAISDLGFAPTIVINALDENAAARMNAYRAAGAEVAMQIQLPEGAQPVDVEVALAAAFRIMPQVAILFSDADGVLQSGRSVTGQVMDVLAADGRGFVSVRRGLGTAQRVASQAGVQVATIDREVDGNGENTAAIGRALDQAAFLTRQTGGAVLLGRMQENTLTALRAWAVSAAEDAVAPAPVSAFLLQQGE